VGGGDIASALNDRDNCIFFASGVSNSQCKDEKEFKREKHKLLGHTTINSMASNWCVFYFSTVSINFLSTPYTRHKKEMENFIKNNTKNYNIIRLGNISWGKNPHTFINAIRAKQAKGEPVKIRDEWKYMISKEQLLLLTDNLPLIGKHEISVFGNMKKVKDCL